MNNFSFEHQSLLVLSVYEQALNKIEIYWLSENGL